MGRKGLLWLLVLAGLGLVAVSVAADAIGIGANDYTFGWEQKLGVATGMSVAWFAGLRLLGLYPLPEREAQPAPEPQRTAPASA
jgi:hypothetical protein